MQHNVLISKTKADREAIEGVRMPLGHVTQWNHAISQAVIIIS